MIKYFIYCRKSTESEEKQALSIEAQLVELREFAKQNNLFVVREFTETKTAKEPGRPVFNKMLDQIEQGIAPGILAWNPDRLARNSVDGGKIIHLVDTNKIQSLKFPTFWFEATPQGKFMLSVAFGQAKYYTDNLRENILRGIRQKLRRGEFPAKAPLGYFNEPRLRTIEPDPKTFNKVEKILTAFATGNYTLTKIQNKMFSLGLVAKNGKPLHLATINNILTNPFYYGVFLYNGELYQGSHKSIIPKKLFDKIQQALKDNGKPRKNKKKKFLFKSFAKCGECGYAITAEEHIKKSGLRFVYYRCTKKSKTKNCKQNHYLSEQMFSEQIKEFTQKASLPDDWKNKYLKKIDEWREQENQSSVVFVQNLKKEILQAKTKIDRLNEAYLEGVFGLEEFKEKKNALVEKLAELKQKLKNFEQKGSHWLELCQNWVLEANQAKNLALTENFSEMKNFLQKIGSNREIADGRLSITFKKPWNFLHSLPVNSRAYSSAGVKNRENLFWWSLLKKVRTYFEQNPDFD
jgi:site-specific DNA recombinase